MMMIILLGEVFMVKEHFSIYVLWGIIIVFLMMIPEFGTVLTVMFLFSTFAVVIFLCIVALLARLCAAKKDRL